MQPRTLAPSPHRFNDARVWFFTTRFGLFIHLDFDHLPNLRMETTDMPSVAIR